MNDAIRQFMLLSFLEQYASQQKPRPPIPDEVKAVITRETRYKPVTDRRKRRAAKRARLAAT